MDLPENVSRQSEESQENSKDTKAPKRKRRRPGPKVGRLHCPHCGADLPWPELENHVRECPKAPKEDKTGKTFVPCEDPDASYSQLVAEHSKAHPDSTDSTPADTRHLDSRPEAAKESEGGQAMKAERHWRTVSVTCGYCHETMSRTDFDGHLSGCMKASRGGSDVVANPESEQEAEAVSEAARRMENERKQEALTVLEAHTPSTPAVSNPGESEVQEQNALSFAIEKALFGSDHYSPVRTKGVKAHRDAIYKLSLTDQTAAQILDLLKELAVRSGSFIEIRNAVLLHEVLMWKLRGQGY